MPQKLANNARALLTASILAADTSITIEAGKADLFPVADTGTDPVNTPAKDWFRATLQKSNGDCEIVHVRTRGSGVAILSNVIRAQEGTTALNFDSGSVIELRMTAEDYENAVNAAADLAAHIADAVDAHDASAISVADAGNFFTGTTVEAALQELGRLQATATVAFSATPTFDTAVAYDHLFGNLTANVTAVTISNPVQSREICIRVKQNGTGGYTWAGPTGAKISGSVGSLANQASFLTLKYNLTDTRWEGTWTVLPV